MAAEPTQTIWLGPGDDQQLIFDNLKQPQLTIAKVDAADSTTPSPALYSGSRQSTVIISMM